MRAGSPTLVPLSIATAAVLAVPVAVVMLSFAVPAGEVWSHLAATVLPRYITNSAWLVLGVGAGVGVVGVGTAWLVTMTRFPGVRIVECALVLPLAMPAYVIAYTYTGLFDFAGPIQSALRAHFGWTRADYWFPEIRSLPGAIAMLTLVLYPYVYLLSRAAFLAQSVCVLEVGRTLGRGPWRCFLTLALPLARPAVVAGIALALMEALGDFGTVQYFGVDTFTSGIYRTWLGMGEPAAAAQLAAFLLMFVFVLLAIEQLSRGEKRFHHSTGYHRALPTHRLGALRGAAALGACAAPVLLGFLVPAAALLGWAIEHRDVTNAATFLTLARNSLLLAAIAAMLVVALALALAYAQRLSGHRAVAIANRVAGLGYAVPGAVLAVGILLPFAWIDDRVDGVMRQAFGVSTGLLLSGTLVAVLAAYVVRFLGLAMGSVEASLARITPNMDAAARTLGAGSTAMLRRVHAPMLAGGLASAALLVFVDVMKELPATLIMRPFNFDTLAVRTYQLAADERLAEAAAPALAIVLAGIVPVLLLARTLARSRPGHAQG